MHTASLVLQVLRQHPISRAFETNPAMSLPVQRRLVDTIESRIAAAGGCICAEVLQSFVCVRHRDLYFAAVGQAPGAWLRFLMRHGDAFLVRIDDRGRPCVVLPASI